MTLLEENKEALGLAEKIVERKALMKRLDKKWIRGRGDPRDQEEWWSQIGTGEWNVQEYGFDNWDLLALLRGASLSVEPISGLINHKDFRYPENPSIRHEFSLLRTHRAAYITALFALAGFSLGDAGTQRRLAEYYWPYHDGAYRLKRYRWLLRKPEFRRLMGDYVGDILDEIGTSRNEVGQKVLKRLIRIAAPEDNEEEVMSTDNGKLEALKMLSRAVGVDLDEETIGRREIHGRKIEVEYQVEEGYKPPALPEAKNGQSAEKACN